MSSKWEFEIFKPKTNTTEKAEDVFAGEEENKQEIGYTEGGTIVDVEDNHCFCKKMIVDDKTKYYVRVGVTGPESGHFFNPWSQMHVGKNIASAFDKRMGKRKFEWKKVKKEAFDLYHKFLVTKNAAWLHNAQRVT